MLNLILREILKVAFTGLVCNRVNALSVPQTTTTTLVAPGMRTLVGAHLVGHAIVHPRDTLGTVTGGVGAVANALSGSQPQAHGIQRTATEILGEVDLDIAQLETAITTLNDVVNEQLRASTARQRQGMIISALLPFIVYLAYSWIQKPASQKVMKEYINALPSPDDFRAIVKDEFEKRESFTKAAIVSISATQLVAAIVLLILFLLIYLVFKPFIIFLL